ncbi:trans-aconitate 2-methyltransferase [Mucilaginibacter sp. UR6-11]|uniref:class I SAM-dependent methyltransferase n=1 Tax=Mucilaginibacter sp. UR6-11 TaxID=1435644 RepID=UPI00351CBDB4|nr:class I SAM-dependent methyltransferase [Mucilaginibacter sp. UR6-11]
MKVTGVDASSEILGIAKTNFPETEFILQDMRELKLDRKFDAIIAWNSFFHLAAEDQPAMFVVFAQHLSPNGILLFTSGTAHGEAWGINGGEHVFHGSLDTAEYEDLLKAYNFEVIKHVVDDKECGATVWMARYIG